MNAPLCDLCDERVAVCASKGRALCQSCLELLGYTGISEGDALDSQGAYRRLL